MLLVISQAAVGATLAVASVTVSVSSRDHGGPVVMAEIEARMSAGHQTSSESVTVRKMAVKAGSMARLEVPLAHGVWTVQARAADYWSPAAVVHVPVDRAVNLSLWPTVRVSSAVAVEGGALPTAIDLDFRGSPEVPSEDRVPPGSLRCPIHAGTVTCEAPSGRLDLRFEVKGFAPEYFWSRDLAPRKANVLRRLSLQPGASVSGFVKTEDGKAADELTVELLTPLGSRIPAAESAKGTRTGGSSPGASRLSVQVRTRERGFFQLRKIEPGEYRLAAHRGPLTGLADVRVQAGLETRLVDALVLEPPIELDVSVEPSLTPDGTNWVVKVLRLAPMATLLHERPVPATGGLKVGPVGQGFYSIEVWNGADRWFGQTVEIKEQPGPIVVRLPLVRLRGELRLGDQPLKGTVIFGGRNGISMEADAEGVFRGSLPHPGDWMVSVEAASPPVTRTLRRIAVEPDGTGEASVSIVLSDTLLRGRVVGQGGSPARAIVDVYPQSLDDRKFQVQTDADGRFAFGGLAPGEVLVSAMSSDQVTDVLSVRMVEGETQEATLILRDERIVRGRMVTTSGSALPGATLTAFPLATPVIAGRYHRTDAEGRFSIELPPATQEIAVFYWADGHALRFFRTGITDEPLLLTAEPGGGSLVIDFGGPYDLFREVERIPILVHAGARASVLQLLDNALRRRVLGEVPLATTLSSITLPQMATGQYALCVQSEREIMANRPVAGHCDRGTLTPGGELRLKVTN